MNDPLEWYREVPIVSRVYLTASFLTTAACALEQVPRRSLRVVGWMIHLNRNRTRRLVSPFTLYFNYKLILHKGQVWRLVTNFLFFGTFSLDFLFHMYFLVRYCRLLEESSFRGRTADLVYLLLFGSTLMLSIAPFINIHFLGSSLTFMMVYIWGRRNEHIRMSFLGLFPFTAPYLPWVLFTFSLLLGNSASVDLIGIAVGHIYFFLEDVYPEIARIRKWRTKRLMRAPGLLRSLCGQVDHEDTAVLTEDLIDVPAAVAAAATEGEPPAARDEAPAGEGAAAPTPVDGPGAAAGVDASPVEANPGAG